MATHKGKAQTQPVRQPGVAAALVPLVPPAYGTSAAISLAAATKPAREVIEQAVRRTMGVLKRLSDLRILRLRDSLGARGLAPDQITAAVNPEVALEQEYRRRSEARLRKALQLALKAPDPSARQAAVQAALDREKRFAQQRGDAVLRRAIGHLERETLKQTSPDGAYWELGPAEEHCVYCPVLAGHFIPWSVLDHPDLRIPVHYGCACRLRSYGDALSNGLLIPGATLEPAQATAMAGWVAAGLRKMNEEVRYEDELDLRVQLAEVPGTDLNLVAALPYGLLERDIHIGSYTRIVDGKTQFVSDYHRLIDAMQMVLNPNHPATRVNVETPGGQPNTLITHSPDTGFVVSKGETLAARAEGATTHLTPQDVARALDVKPDPLTQPVRDPGAALSARLAPEIMDRFGQRAEEVAHGPLMHGADQTSDVYRGADGVWQGDRAQLHTEYWQAQMHQADTGPEPEIGLVIGGSASGKSSVKGKLRDLPVRSIQADPDIGRGVLPEMGVMTDEKRIDAAQRTQAEAVYMHNGLVAQGLAARVNMTVDAGGGADTLNQIQHAADQQYGRMSVDMVSVPTEVAAERAINRAATKGRSVDVTELRRSHQAASANFPNVLREVAAYNRGKSPEQALTSGGHVRVWDTSTTEPRMIAYLPRGSRSAKDLVVLDPQAYKAFLDKKHENPEPEGLRQRLGDKARNLLARSPLHGLSNEKPPQPTNDFEALYAEATRTQEEYKALLDLGKGYAQHMGADTIVAGDDIGDFVQRAKALSGTRPTVVIAPMKSRESAQAKLTRKGYGADKLIDINRASVVLPQADMVQPYFAELRAWADRNGWSMHEPHDMLFGDAGPDGYRDLGVLMKSPGGVVTEMQFHLGPMWRAKFAGGGHELYENWRRFEEIKTERPLTEDEVNRQSELLQRMSALYTRAAQEAGLS